MRRKEYRRHRVGERDSRLDPMDLKLCQRFINKTPKGPVELPRTVFVETCILNCVKTLK